MLLTSFCGPLSLQVVYLTATVPYVLILILLIRGTTLEGAMNGIEFYIGSQSNFTKLTDQQVKNKTTITMYNIKTSGIFWWSMCLRNNLCCRSGRMQLLRLFFPCPFVRVELQLLLPITISTTTWSRTQLLYRSLTMVGKQHFTWSTTKIIRYDSTYYM